MQASERVCDIGWPERVSRGQRKLRDMENGTENGPSPPASKIYSLQEVKSHATEDDCWIIVHGAASPCLHYGYGFRNLHVIL